jgi:hypothetical protein
VCQQWPLSLSPWGIYGYVAQCFSRDGRPTQPELFIRYEDIRVVDARGHDLHVNHRHFLRLTVPAFARRLAALIRELKTLPESERGPVIAAALARHLDSREVRRRLDLFADLAADMRITCSLLFFVVLLLPPLLIWLESYFSLLAFLGSYVGLAFLAAVQFYRIHRILYPEERFERWKNALVMLISPADVVHARDKLSRPLLGECSPLSVAEVVCAPAEFREFAEEVWRDAEFPLLPICPVADADPRATEAWFRQAWREQLGRFLQEAGIVTEAAVAPPPPDSGESQSYCPRCRGQYVLALGVCHDCGGRELQAISSQSPSAGDGHF